MKKTNERRNRLLLSVCVFCKRFYMGKRRAWKRAFSSLSLLRLRLRRCCHGKQKGGGGGAKKPFSIQRARLRPHSCMGKASLANMKGRKGCMSRRGFFSLIGGGGSKKWWPTNPPLPLFLPPMLLQLLPCQKKVGVLFGVGGRRHKKRGRGKSMIFLLDAESYCGGGKGPFAFLVQCISLLKTY